MRTWPNKEFEACNNYCGYNKHVVKAYVYPPANKCLLGVCKSVKHFINTRDLCHIDGCLTDSVKLTV